jgi:predicted Zn-dependent protease
LDFKAVSDRAIEKAKLSRNPVAIEPGRYTVILEPQAVHDLVNVLVASLDRIRPDHGHGPFTLGYDAALKLWRTKLGLKVVDERVTIEHDPTDPKLGVLPFDNKYAVPYRAMKWIDRGVLTELADTRDYSLQSRNDNLPAAASFAFRMSGGDTTIEEMIKSTKRGLLVTRFSNTRLLDADSLLTTGLTRDGLWLIENGQITKAVKNFRFTESPLFVLNSLDQLGVPVPVFRPHFEIGVSPAIVPPVKARDFSFTSTIDAI